MSQIRVARLVAVNEPLEVGKEKKPFPGSTDVLVKVEACSLVPSSYNIVTGKTKVPLPTLPCIFGLDTAGVIEAVGEHVFNLKIGDRVYVDPYLTCRTCHQCRQGHQDLCHNSCFRGYFSHQTNGSAGLLDHYPIGGLSEYLISPDTNIAILPKSIDTAIASRLGYGTSFAGLKKAGVGPGKTLLISGITGTLGRAAVAIGLGLGCTKILGIGRSRERLREVESSSTPGRIIVRSSEDEHDLLQWMREHTDGQGPDALYDCLGSGGDATITENLIRGVRPGGRAVLAAAGVQGNIVQSYQEVMVRNVAVLGTNWFKSADLDDLLALIDAGIIDLSYLRHQFFPLDQVNEAFRVIGSHPGGALNVVVQPQV